MAVHGDRWPSSTCGSPSSRSRHGRLRLPRAVAGDVAPPHRGAAPPRPGARRPADPPADRGRGPARRTSGRPVDHLRRRQQRSSGRCASGSGRCRVRVAPTLRHALPSCARRSERRPTPRPLRARRAAPRRQPCAAVGPRWPPWAPWADVAALMARVRADLDALAGRMLPDALRRAISASLRATSTSSTGCCCPTRSADADRLVVPSRTLAHRALGAAPPPSRAAHDRRAVGHRLGPRPVRARSPSPRVAALAGPGLQLLGVRRSRASRPAGPVATPPTARTAAPPASRRRSSTTTSCTSPRTAPTTTTTRSSPASG